MSPGYAADGAHNSCEMKRTLDVKGNQVDNLGIDAEKEIELLDQTIIELKTNRNALVPINRLPVELLSLIFLLTASPISKTIQHYLPYTWVCHRWRSVLIQDSAFWTFIHYERQKKLNSDQLRLLSELAGRSKSAELDVILPNAVELEGFFATECHRFRSLWLTNNSDLELFDLSSKPFSYTLRKLILPWFGLSSRSHGLFDLLPALEASCNLEILECAFSDYANPPVARLGPLFSQLRRLNIKIESRSPIFIQSVLTLLHNSIKLQNLEFTSTCLGTTFSPEITVLPELRILWTDTPYLMDHIRAPKLVELKGVISGDSVHQILDDFNFSSMRYLCLLNSRLADRRRRPVYCVVGSTKARHCKISEEKSKIFFEDVFPEHYPRNFFHIRLQTYEVQEIIANLQAISSAILPRMTSLTELQLLIPHFASDILDFITQPPPIEKLVIQSGGEVSRFLRLLSDPAFCPKLKELSYESIPPTRNRMQYVQHVGKTLTETLRKRKENGLKKITLEGCPSLPDVYLKTLQKFDTIVQFGVVT